VPQITAVNALAAAEALEDGELAGDGDTDSALTAGVLRVHAQRLTMQATEQRRVDGFALAHPNVLLTSARALAQDVHDLNGLRTLGDALAEPA
jgi:hypothetical protein